MKIKKFLLNPFIVFSFLASKGKLLFISEKLMVKLIYRGQMGKKLNLKNPKTFNEKMQWLKVYDHNPLYTKLVDKHEVREFVRTIIGEKYLIPELKLWDSPKEINLEELPNKFVIKCTHDSGSVLVIRNKDKIEQDSLIKHFLKRTKRSHYWAGREWPYKNVKPRIIVEQYLETDGEGGLKDYKFYCFNGVPMFLYVSSGLDNHETAKISFFDLDGNRMPFGRSDYNPIDYKIEMPSKFEEMKKIASVCASEIGADFVRVDLFEVNNRVFFSEFTFTPCGGYMPFSPEDYDEIIGELLKLTKKDK